MGAAILTDASKKMDEHPDCVSAKNVYALVAYIPEPLATFLNGLRRRIDPGSEPNAHVTLLPPRALSGSPEEAIRQIDEFARHQPPFELVAANVEIFDCTHVVFLEVELNRQLLEKIHRALNNGALSAIEPYTYHPHITLVQCHPPDEAQSRAEATRAGWATYTGPRRFVVNRLTFVKHVCGNQWQDLASFDLEPAQAGEKAQAEANDPR
jgi:2'-5' RNA ligase